MTAVGQERSGSREDQQRERCSLQADGRAFGQTTYRTEAALCPPLFPEFLSASQRVSWEFLRNFDETLNCREPEGRTPNPMKLISQ